MQNILLKMDQNYFIFQPLLKYFEASRTTVSVKVMAWKYKGSVHESIKLPAASDYSLNPKLDYFSNHKF